MTISRHLAIAAICLAQPAGALQLPLLRTTETAIRPPHLSAQSRRQLLQSAAAAAVLIPSAAAHASQDVNDLTRLKRGLDQVQYLLDNWDKETTDPITGDDSPDRVRYFVGLRTTDHPLFQVDKLLTKAQTKLPDEVDIEVWADSVEGLNSHIAKINELAYTSSFGEYNPGGGKAQVRKYLLLAKEEVVLARDSLKTMVKLLQI